MVLPPILFNDPLPILTKRKAERIDYLLANSGMFDNFAAVIIRQRGDNIRRRDRAVREFVERHRGRMPLTSLR